MSQLLLAAPEHANELPVHPLVLGVGTFGVLVLLLLVTISFDRNR